MWFGTDAFLLIGLSFFSDLPVDKIPLTLFHNKPTPISKNTLLTTIPLLPKQFDISFDFKPTQWLGGWTNILHMSKAGNAAWGDRIPGIFVYNRKIAIASAIDGSGNWLFYTLPPTLNKWTHIRIIQRLEKDVFVYRAYMDGFLMREKVNTRAEDFHNVDVWLADNWYNTQPGFLKNLNISGKPTDSTCEILSMLLKK